MFGEFKTLVSKLKISGLANLANERGNAAVELALMMPILMLILFGIINFGVLIYNQSVITNAAREGARWASIHTTASNGITCTNSSSTAPVDPCQAAYSYAFNALVSFGGSYLLTASKITPADYNQGTPQSVTVSYTYTGIGWTFGSQGPTQYSATAVMIHD